MNGFVTSLSVTEFYHFSLVLALINVTVIILACSRRLVYYCHKCPVSVSCLPLSRKSLSTPSTLYWLNSTRCVDTQPRTLQVTVVRMIVSNDCVSDSFLSLFSLSSVFCCRAGSGYPNGYPVLGNSRGGFPLPSSRFVITYCDQSFPSPWHCLSAAPSLSGATLLDSHEGVPLSVGYCYCYESLSALY